MADAAIDAAALATALASLATAITQLNANNAGGGAGGAGGNPAPLLDPFAATAPFDLSSRAGSTAYSTACSVLEEIWDGTPNTLPSFLVCLRIRADEVKWDAADPHGILTYGTHNLLTGHHNITDATLEAARTARTDPRALQNSKAMYECLKKSVTGNLRSTLFGQASNLMTNADGPIFFKLMLSFTTVSSLQLSILSFNQILQFDPAIVNFNIPAVNTKLTNLFTLATTSSRVLSEAEKIQHILTAYQRIRQPEIWAQWIRNQVDNFEQGNITNSQAFMNTAVVKYNKICIENDGQSFPGSSTTLQEDIVAMMVSVKRKTAPKPDVKGKEPSASSDPDKNKKPKLPPFVKHFKSSSADDAVKYKVGDTKTWNKLTWHFCDYPNHRDKQKWHTHSPDECRLRKKWLESNTPVGANAILDDDAPEPPQDEESTAQDAPANPLAAMLANALTLASDNSEASELISEALNAIHLS
jgi:hypothetical protein